MVEELKDVPVEVASVVDQVLAKALRVLAKYSLCDSCLGRLFARLGHGIENSARGSMLKDLLYMASYHMLYVRGDRRSLDVLKVLAKSGHRNSAKIVERLGERVEQEECYICRGLMRDVERHHANVVEALKRYEFNSFEIGCRVPKDVIQREFEVIREFELDTAESIKREVNRRIGRVVRGLLKKPVDKSSPDVLAVVDVASGEVSVTPMPVLIYTRYLKLCRGVSQAQKIEGVLTTILEELRPVADYFGGKELVVHAAGREDVDARMLGSGRPIIIEVKSPSRFYRDVDVLRNVLSSLSSRCLLLKLDEVRLARRGEVRELKETVSRKVKLYRVLALADREVGDEELSRLESSRGLVVVQKRPTRIKRKRVRTRRRMVYEIRAVRVTPRVLEFFIRAQGGLYIKEFITGDFGRTSPSVSEILGVSLEPIELDVLDVE